MKEQAEFEGMPPRVHTAEEIARRLTRAWVALQPVRPAEYDIKKQAKRWLLIANRRPLRQIAVAWRGLEHTPPFNRGAWDAYQFDNHFVRLLGNGAETPNDPVVVNASAGEAWLLVRTCMTTSYDARKRDGGPLITELDPAGKAALDALGGLTGLSNMQVGSVAYARREFVRAYIDAWNADAIRQRQALNGLQQKRLEAGE